MIVGCGAQFGKPRANRFAIEEIDVIASPADRLDALVEEMREQMASGESTGARHQTDSHGLAAAARVVLACRRPFRTSDGRLTGSGIALRSRP